MEAVPLLSQHSVRPKGLEPLTFWLGVILDRFSRPKRDALDAEYEALCAEAAIR